MQRYSSSKSAPRTKNRSVLSASAVRMIAGVRMKRRKAGLPASVWKNPVHWLAFGFGAGTISMAPGTFGTLVAVPIHQLIQGWPLWFYLSMTGVMFTVGIWLCGRTAHDIGVHDHSGIVWDEIVGFLITMTAAPRGWQWVALGFVLFRFFDILKPWPIRRLERAVPGGLGIMLDDVLAAVYAAGALQASVYWLAG